jgi:putative transposase
LNKLYKEIGISKQAVSQYVKRQKVFDYNVHNLIVEAEELRKEHPGCGVEKMYYTLRPDFIGRDNFIDLFMSLGFRIKKNKNYRRTTFASRVNYPNLIKGMEVSKPSTIWQSDITYIYCDNKFYYAVFIIDVYTKKIVGHQLTNHMRASANVKALEMAFKSNKAPSVHHSDRGSQYTSTEYLELLKENNVQISMALFAQDNAYAERINKTIKEEYIDRWKPKNYAQLNKMIDKAVNQYNNRRPLNHIGKLSPMKFEENWYNNLNFSKPKITIFNNEI